MRASADSSNPKPKPTCHCQAKPAAASTHATVSSHGTPTAPVFHHARLTAIEQSAPPGPPSSTTGARCCANGLCCVAAARRAWFPVLARLAGFASPPRLAVVPCGENERTSGSTVRNANALPQQTPPWPKAAVTAVVFAKADSIGSYPRRRRGREGRRHRPARARRPCRLHHAAPARPDCR